MALLKESAEKGSARAGYLLGTLHRQGIGLGADEYGSFYWCRRAAEQGLLTGLQNSRTNPRSRNTLSSAYSRLGM